MVDSCLIGFTAKINFLITGTVDGPRIPELTLLDAYQKLRLSIYRKEFQIQVENDNQEVSRNLTS